MRRIAIVFVAGLVLGIGSGAARAAAPSPGNPHLAAALEQVRALQEKAALKSLEKARTWPQNTPHEISLYHLYSGLAHAGLGRSEKAIASFRTALIIEPDLELPEGMAPRVIGWFQQAGGRTASLVPTPAAEVPSGPVAKLEAVTADPPRPEAVARPVWRTWTGISGLALGTFAVAAAISSGVSASTSAAQARSAPSLDAATKLHAEAQRSARTANILYASGATVAIGGGLIFFW